MSASHRAPGLVALAALWGAVDVAYSIYLLATDPAGVLRIVGYWLPYARQAAVVSSILGVFIGGALFVGAFMTHHGSRRGLLVLLGGIALYSLSGLSYAAWGLATHESVSATITMSEGVDRGNDLNNTIWSYFVAIGCVSILVGGAFTFAIRHAWVRFPATPEQGETESHPLRTATSPPTPAGSMSHEIERLNDLRERGLLTDEEYGQAKAKVLAAGGHV